MQLTADNSLKHCLLNSYMLSDLRYVIPTDRHFSHFTDMCGISKELANIHVILKPCLLKLLDHTILVTLLCSVSFRINQKLLLLISMLMH